MIIRHSRTWISEPRFLHLNYLTARRSCILSTSIWNEDKKSTTERLFHNRFRVYPNFLEQVSHTRPTFSRPVNHRVHTPIITPDEGYIADVRRLTHLSRRILEEPEPEPQWIRQCTAHVKCPCQRCVTYSESLSSLNLLSEVSLPTICFSSVSSVFAQSSTLVSTSTCATPESLVDAPSTQSSESLFSTMLIITLTTEA